ncbi:MAG: hypothetical protein ACREC5_05370 [Thermoplasmata archaeon]
MEIKHVGHRGTSLDPTQDALALAGKLLAERPGSDPMGPAQFWRELAGLGFYFMRTGLDGRIQRVPDSDPAVAGWGEFYASILLEHAAATGLLGGDPAAERYWKKE